MRCCAGLLSIWQGTSTQMLYPLVTDLAADGVPVVVTCRVLGFSKQGYYRWKTSPVTERD
jgi:putative transposase